MSNIDKIQDLCETVQDYTLEEMELAELRDDDECHRALKKLYSLSDIILMGNVSKETYKDVQNSINEVLLFENTEDGYSDIFVDMLYSLYKLSEEASA